MLVTRAEAIRFAEAIKFSGAPAKPLTADQEDVLDQMIAAATPVIESVVGPVEVGTRTVETAFAQAGPLIIPWPFTTVVSVTVDGVLVPAGQYVLVGAARGVLYPAGLGPAPWAYRSVTVTVQVGAAVVAPNVKQAALELISYWWQSTKQGERTAWQEGIPMGFAIPSRVKELLAATPALPGFG